MAYNDIQPAGTMLPHDEDFKLEIFLPPVLRDQAADVSISELDANTGLSDADVALKMLHQENSEVNAWVAMSRELHATLDEFSAVQLDNIVLSRKIADDDTSKDYDVAHMAQMMGFVLPDAIMQNVLHRNIRPLMPLLARYAETNSTDRWSDFLSVLLGGRVIIKYLYTKDYIEFLVTPQGKLLQDGGDWFASTHISIKINYAGYTDTVLGSAFSTEKGVSIVEAYMPINLVIHRFGFYLRSDIPVGIGVAGLALKGFNVAPQYVGDYDHLSDKIATGTKPVTEQY